MTRLVRDIGIRHGLFGTNWPLYDPGVDIEVIDSLALSDGEKQANFFENASAILDEPPA